MVILPVVTYHHNFHDDPQPILAMPTMSPPTMTSIMTPIWFFRINIQPRMITPIGLDVLVTVISSDLPSGP